MRSKTSFFNPTLFKKNLARFWPLWGGVSVIGALIPLYALTELIQDGFRSHAGEARNVLAAHNPMLVDAVPLTLEEIFIYELGGADYAVKDIVL